MKVIFLADMNRIIEYLKNKRIEKGFSINQLAMYSRVSASQISRMESGERKNPKMSTLLKLSRSLGIADTEFLTESGYLPKGSGVNEFTEAYDQLLNIEERLIPHVIFSSLSNEETDALEAILEDPVETKLFRDFLVASKKERLAFLRAWREIRKIQSEKTFE